MSNSLFSGSRRGVWHNVVLIPLVLCAAAVTQAGGPPPLPPPGVHSTICTSDGQIRDDFLVTHLANEINAYGGQVQDVKIFLNTCYGGGFLGEFSMMFGAGGPCAGVPWVFGSAADWYEYAWAFRAEWCVDPVANLGSKLTSALAGPHSGHWDSTPGAMRDAGSHNVLADLNTAVQHDEAGPFHEQAEHPVITVGNGGESILWNASGTSHEIVLFGGRMDQPAYYNDMENMQDALQNLYGGAPHNIQVIPNGTIQDLLDGISAACANLDANTQLLLHFTDHGGFTVDVVEHLQAQGHQPPYSIPQFQDIVIWWPPPIPPPWPPKDPNEPDPEVDLDLTLLEPIQSEHWVICVNDVPVAMPPGTLEGELELPVAWESLRPDENHLTICAVGEPSGPFVFDAMELSSGPVPMATDLEPTAAVCTALGYRFTAPWFPGSAIPYMVPPQTDGPIWQLEGPVTYAYSDPGWPDRQGFWGVAGPLQTGVLKARVFSSASPGETQQVVIEADLMTNAPDDNHWNVVVQPPAESGFAQPAAHGPQVTSASPNPDGSMRYTWTQELTPIGPLADIAITLQTGANGADYVFIDNVTIETVGRPKDPPPRPDVPPEQQDKSQSHYYYFCRPEWPPAAHYAVLPTWHEGTIWERFGSSPPEWLPDVAGHHGVMGLWGEVPGDGQLVVHFDDQAEPAGREYVACQFDYFSAAGSLWWQPVMPPETVIENVHEEIGELGDGWMRVYLTFEVSPPPAWQDFHWFFNADGMSGPVVIDNFAMSGSPWWADFWHDAFDFHEVDQSLHGQYGWKGWDNNPLGEAFVTDVQARTPFHAVRVEGPTDLVQEFDLPAARWVFTTWQYVPSDFVSGCDATGENCGSYFILLSAYQDGGPYHWSVQLHADSLTGAFIRDQATPVALPLMTDGWVRIDVLVDLVTDTYRVYYDGTELGTAASWTDGVYGGGGGALAIGALDLFANGSTEVYYDDLHLQLVAPGDLNCDGAVDFGDINPFVLILSSPTVWQATYPNCPWWNGDINGNGHVGFDDINPFVLLLSRGRY